MLATSNALRLHSRVRACRTRTSSHFKSTPFIFRARRPSPASAGFRRGKKKNPQLAGVLPRGCLRSFWRNSSESLSLRHALLLPRAPVNAERLLLRGLVDRKIRLNPGCASIRRISLQGATGLGLGALPQRGSSAALLDLLLIGGRVRLWGAVALSGGRGGCRDGGWHVGGWVCAGRCPLVCFCSPLAAYCGQDFDDPAWFLFLV